MNQKRKQVPKCLSAPILGIGLAFASAAHAEYAAYTVRATEVHPAPFVETILFTLPAGSFVYAVEHNASYALIKYSYGQQWYSGLFSCGNISVTQPDSTTPVSWYCF
jgi:hypothetical protein